MAAYPNLPARYSKGTLKLRRRLRLPEGTEVRVTIVPVGTSKRRKPTRRGYRYPTRTIRWANLRELSGIVSLGGDALADSEALYDGE
jgi:predicted DNA-binding antitoxin AbrB/MazE fold protein